MGPIFTIHWSMNHNFSYQKKISIQVILTLFSVFCVKYYLRVIKGKFRFELNIFFISEFLIAQLIAR